MKKLICIVFLLITFITFITCVLYKYHNNNESYENVKISDEKIVDPRIEIRNIKYFHGPNQWNYLPSIEITIDIKEFEKNPSNTFPFLYDTILSEFPSLLHHRCSKDYKGGFLERVKEGTYFGHIIEHLALELQHFTGFAGGMGRTREIGENSGIYKIMLSAGHHSKESILECFYCAVDLLLAMIDRRPFDIVEYQNRIVDASRHNNFGSNLLEIIYCLNQYNIPYFKLTDSGSFIQLGYGNRQKRLWITTTDQTSGISDSIVGNKNLTKKFLEQQGISTPKGTLVSSKEEAVEQAKKIGYPVVVKPSNGNHANGVSKNITDDMLTKKAFDFALSNNKDDRVDVIVEKYIEGDSYRITLVNNRIIAACRHIFHTIPVTVQGDGKASIERLIDRVLAKFILEEGHYNYTHYKNKTLEIKKVDVLINYRDSFFKRHLLYEFLEKNGYQKDSVIPDGKQVLVDLVYDGYQDIDIEKIPISIQKSCERATRIVGIDICGIDIIIGSFREDTNYAILEMNTCPDLRVHRNSKHNVGRAIVHYLFKDAKHHFPMFGITGDGDRAAVNRFLTDFFTTENKVVGSVGEGGVLIGRKRMIEKETNHQNVQDMLSNTTIDMAIIDNDISVIDQEGLAYRYANAIILGYKSDMFKLLRTQIDIVKEGGTVVLNADDLNVSDLIEIVESETDTIIFYGMKSYDKEKIVYYDSSKDAIFIKIGSNTLLLMNSIQRKGLHLPTILPSIAGIWSYFDLTIPHNRLKLVDFINIFF